MKLKILFALFAIFAAAIASAGTLTVTSPTEGAFLGTNNTLSFNITGAQVEVTVTVDITGPTGGTTHIERRFLPDADGKITSSIPLTFSQSSPEGAYTIVVNATEPNAAAYTPITLHVTVDVTKPKFFDYNPTPNSFVKGPGVVPIVVKVVDANFKEYRVQVNGQDIPNNTGTTLDSNNSFVVNWDVSGILQDGPQTITITVKDKADQESTQTLTVTVDRVKPTATIQFPRADTPVRPRSTVTVIVDVSDATSNSVDVTGVDVVIRDMNDKFILRVPRTTFLAQSSTTSRWSGRIRSDIKLPSKFKLIATTTDKAGNVGVPQTTIVKVG